MNGTELRRLMSQREGNVEFKKSLPSRKVIAEYAVGIGNAGGGWLIIGVTDRLPRQIVPFKMPSMDELDQIRSSVADSAQIHVTFETLHTQDGSVLIIGIPSRSRGQVLHTLDGKYLTRLSGELRGLTTVELDSIRAEGGDELTARLAPGSADRLIRAAALEELRVLMREATAPADLLQQSDGDLLRSLNLLHDDGRLRYAGLLLVGHSEPIRDLLPHAQWQFRRMLSDTDYDQADGGYDCIAIALKRLREMVAANNPIVTIPGWLIHPEFPRYPALALRELLVNALVHRDYEAMGTVYLKLYPDRLELTNPGGFFGGVTPQNILHHASVSRYPALMQALARMRLANQANLGVPRVFHELLQEGKEPPIYNLQGTHVRVVVLGQDAREPFLCFVKEYPGLNVDHLLIVHYLTRHREISTRTVADLCQRSLREAREDLSELIHRWEILESCGSSGAGRYYRLSRRAYDLLLGALSYHVDRRLAYENARARILQVLKSRDLANADIREITQLGPNQVYKLMVALEKEGLVKAEGSKRGRRWRLP